MAALATPHEHVLYSFAPRTDGNYPVGSLVAGADGSIYGTTLEGGRHSPKCGRIGCGIAYRLSPPAKGQSGWTETIIHRFRGSPDGSNPFAGVVSDSSGALYGTTMNGGTANLGTVFKLTPPADGDTEWHEEVIHSFLGGTDGAFPAIGVAVRPGGAIIAAAGNCVIRLRQPDTSRRRWRSRTIYTFSGGADGYQPVGLLAGPNGKIYGAAFGGGRDGDCGGHSCGMVFELRHVGGAHEGWGLIDLYEFPGMQNGSAPNSGLIADATGALYGTTIPAALSDGPSIYRLSPPAHRSGSWTLDTLYTFAQSIESAIPAPSLAMGGDGVLYLPTGFGGAPDCMQHRVGCGSIEEITPPTPQPDTWTASTLYAFGPGKKGHNATAVVLRPGSSTIFGTTGAGGDAGRGTVFAIEP